MTIFMIAKLLAKKNHWSMHGQLKKINILTLAIIIEFLCFPERREREREREGGDNGLLVFITLVPKDL